MNSILSVLRDNSGMDDVDLTQLNLDVYDTRHGPWNPDHGEIEIPDHWDFLRSGNAFVTRTVKASGIYWVSWKPRNRNRRHRRRIGLWAPRDAIADALGQAAATAESRTVQRQQSARSRERAEGRYLEELSEAVLKFLSFDPAHADLAKDIASRTAERAAVVGSGRVGRTRLLSIEERAELAARAHIRHHHTDYEDELIELDPEEGDDYLDREVKAEAGEKVDEFLSRHRS